MTKKEISRRNFLKTGCITTVAAGVTLGGVVLATNKPEVPEISFPSFLYGEKTGTKRLLMVYASATGSTVEIAEAIGKTIAAEGWLVDGFPAQDKPKPEDYDAVLIGSAVQYGEWLAVAMDYVKENQQALTRLPVGLFCVHIRNIEDDEISRNAREAYLGKVRKLITPVCEGYFAGRFNAHGAALLMPGFIARLIPDMDMRNFDKVHTWAKNISLVLA